MPPPTTRGYAAQTRFKMLDYCYCRNIKLNWRKKFINTHRVVKLQRGFFLMNKISSNKEILDSFQRCRLFMKSVTLAEICIVQGDCISQPEQNCSGQIKIILDNRIGMSDEDNCGSGSLTNSHLNSRRT